MLDASQYLDGGPCVEVSEGHADVVVFPGDDPLDEERWRLFSQATSAGGVASTLSLPLHEEGRSVAGFDKSWAAEQAFAGRIEQLAMLVGAAPTTAVSNADLSFSLRIEAAAAPRQMRDRAIIETAVGWVAGVKGIDVEAAAHECVRGGACGDPRGPGRAGACLGLHAARGLNGHTRRERCRQTVDDHLVLDRRRGEATRARSRHTCAAWAMHPSRVGRHPDDPAGRRCRAFAFLQRPAGPSRSPSTHPRGDSRTSSSTTSSTSRTATTPIRPPARNTVSTVIAIDPTLKPDLGTRARDRVSSGPSPSTSPRRARRGDQGCRVGPPRRPPQRGAGVGRRRLPRRIRRPQPRESDVLQLVVLGHSNQEIADTLFLSMNSGRPTSVPPSHNQADHPGSGHRLGDPSWFPHRAL